jgi:hypothetical protein
MFSKISKIVCISLRGREHRRALANQEFIKAGIADQVEWLIVEPHPDPKAGFSQSQFRALQMCAGHEHSLIFEDDVRLTGNISLDDIFSELPSTFRACWLGGNVRSLNHNRVSRHLWRCLDTWTTHAVIYSRAGVDAVLSNYEAPDVIERDDQIFDEWLRVNFQPGGECYICRPFFAVQSEGWSDIENRPTYYGPMWRRSEIRLS